MKLTATSALLAVLTLAGAFGLSRSLADVQAVEETPVSADNEAGFTVLFDGTSTDAFREYKKETFPAQGWAIEDGTLHVISKGNGGNIVTKSQYSDFDLRWEWKVADGSNSGVMYRVAETESAPFMTGPEYQILDDTKHKDGGNAKTSTGALYALIACNEKKHLKPTGEWNSSRILIDGGKVQHFLNGELVVEYVWGSDEINALIADSKFKQWKSFMKKDTGHISLQYHGDDVWFRNIRIKDLSK